MSLSPTERMLVVATGIGVLHHVDHVLRLDHSGWPFRPDVTPFTYSLVVYPIILALFLLRGRPWLRVTGAGMIFGFVTFSHAYFETPHDQFHTWAHGSPSAAYAGVSNLLGVQSVALGSVAVVLTVALSLAFLAVTVGFWREARRRG
jgi:hypothetical protein